MPRKSEKGLKGDTLVLELFSRCFRKSESAGSLERVEFLFFEEATVGTSVMEDRCLRGLKGTFRLPETYLQLFSNFEAGDPIKNRRAKGNRRDSNGQVYCLYIIS